MIYTTPFRNTNESEWGMRRLTNSASLNALLKNHFKIEIGAFKKSKHLELREKEIGGNL